MTLSAEHRLRYDTKPLCWAEKSEKLFRVWIGNECRGFPFDKLIDACYFEQEQTLSLHWPTGQIVITGPKALEFYNEFANGRATLLKADGTDILSVTMVQPAAMDAESKTLHPEQEIPGVCVHKEATVGGV